MRITIELEVQDVLVLQNALAAYPRQEHVSEDSKKRCWRVRRDIIEQAEKNADYILWHKAGMTRDCCADHVGSNLDAYLIIGDDGKPDLDWDSMLHDSL